MLMSLHTRPRRSLFRALVLTVAGLAASAAGQTLTAGTASATPVVVQLTPGCSTSGVAGINISVFNPLHDPADTAETWGQINPGNGAPPMSGALAFGSIPAGAPSAPVFVATGPGHVTARLAAQVHTPTETRASDPAQLEVDVPACTGPEDATSTPTVPPVPEGPSAPGVVVEDSLPQAVLDPTTTSTEVHPVPRGDVAGFVITATTAVVSIDPPVTISRWHNTTDSTLPVTGAAEDARNAMLRLSAIFVLLVGVPLVLLGRWLRRNRPPVIVHRYQQHHRGHQ